MTGKDLHKPHRVGAVSTPRQDFLSACFSLHSGA